MNASIPEKDESGSQPANRQGWSPPVERLKVGEMPAGAVNLNVDGRQVSGPLQGFGQLWQKTFRVRLAGVDATPDDVMQTWRQNFPRFHAKENRFYTSPGGIQPGEVLLINAMTPGGPVDTGMLVLYVDDEAFTLMTPEGHPESGWVTFSVGEEEGVTYAQVQTLARANDPFYELAFKVAGSKLQDSIWLNVLTNLAQHYGLQGVVDVQKVLVDSRRQWNRARNIWHNAQIRTLVYTAGAPVRWARKFTNRPAGTP